MRRALARRDPARGRRGDAGVQRWTIRRRRCRRWRAASRRRATRSRQFAADAGRRAHADDQGTAVRGRDQHRARHRLQRPSPSPRARPSRPARSRPSRRRRRWIRSCPASRSTCKLRFTNRGSVDVQRRRLIVAGDDGWRVSRLARAGRRSQRDQTLRARFARHGAGRRRRSRAHIFSRPSIVESRYTVSDGAPLHRPASLPAVRRARLRYRVDGCAGRHPRAGDPARGAAAVRLRDARAGGRAGARGRTSRRAQAIVPLAAREQERSACRSS